MKAETEIVLAQMGARGADESEKAAVRLEHAERDLADAIVELIDATTKCRYLARFEG